MPKPKRLLPLSYTSNFCPLIELPRDNILCGFVVPTPTFPLASIVKRDDVAPPIDVVEATSKRTVEAPNAPSIESFAAGVDVPILKLPAELNLPYSVVFA